jgi:carbon-monoxide dehydrogenase small subunit
MPEQMKTISVTVNGVRHERTVDVRTLLVDLLRDELHLTGTHIGCEEGICGACSIEVNGELVKSCLMLAVAAAGAEIVTIEGVGSTGAMDDPVQAGFWESYAAQCGFCTPGMVVAARNLVHSNNDPSETEIREHLVGNLCRCTGYQPIIAGVQRAGELMREERSTE